MQQVTLRTVKVGLPSIEQHELELLTSEIENILSKSEELCSARINELENLISERMNLWKKGKEFENWLNQAENKLESRLSQFPVNPDTMAKIISQYKSFTRELLSRQQPLQSLQSEANSLQVNHRTHSTSTVMFIQIIMNTGLEDGVSLKGTRRFHNICNNDVNGNQLNPKGSPNRL